MNIHYKVCPLFRVSTVYILSDYIIKEIIISLTKFWWNMYNANLPKLNFLILLC